LQDQRERADLIHLKAGTEVGGATLPDEPPALVGRVQGGFPTTLQAAPTSDVGVGLPAIRARSLARLRAKDGPFIGSMEIHRAMPQDVEAQAGQLGNQSEQRPGQPCSQQVLMLFEGEKLQGFDLYHPFQRRSLVSVWALDCRTDKAFKPLPISSHGYFLIEIRIVTCSNRVKSFSKTMITTQCEITGCQQPPPNGSSGGPNKSDRESAWGAARMVRTICRLPAGETADHQSALRWTLKRACVPMRTVEQYDRNVPGKAAEGRRTPGRWREFLRLPTTRSVLDCASPLALLGGDVTPSEDGSPLRFLERDQNFL